MLCKQPSKAFCLDCLSSVCMVSSGLKNLIGDSMKNKSEVYLSFEELAERYGVAIQTIYRWLENDPTFPRPKKFTKRCVRFPLSLIEAWEASKEGAV